MRGVTLVALLLLLATVLAGCAAEKKDDPSTQSTSSGASGSGSGSGSASGSKSSTGTGSGTGAGSGPGASGSAPTANLTVSATNGTAPLNLTFTIAGSVAAGKAASWTLAAGNTSLANGTSLPANATHVFTAAGIHDVVLTVSDGTANATDNVTVTVLAGIVPSGDLPKTYTFTGTATGASDPYGGIRLYGENIEHAFAVLPGTKQIHFLLSWAPFVPGATDLDLYVDDAAGTQRGASTCGNFGPVDPGVFNCNRAGDEETTIVDIQPGDVGEWTAIIAPFEAPSVDYTLTVTLS